MKDLVAITLTIDIVYEQNYDITNVFVIYRHTRLFTHDLSII